MGLLCFFSICLCSCLPLCVVSRVIISLLVNGRHGAARPSGRVISQDEKIVRYTILYGQNLKFLSFNAIIALSIMQFK